LTSDPEIQLSLSENFASDDYNAARELFREFGTVDANTYIRMSAQLLDPIIIITLVSTAFACGFFGKMGEDAYEAIKSRIASFLAQRRHPTAPTTVELNFPYEGMNVKPQFDARSIDLTNAALSGLHEIPPTLGEQSSSNTWPRVDEVYFQFDEETRAWQLYWALSSRPFVKYRYSHDNRTWEEQPGRIDW